MSDTDSSPDDVPDRDGVDGMTQLVMRILEQALPEMLEGAITRYMENRAEVTESGAVPTSSQALENRGGYVSLQALLSDPGAKTAADK